MDVPEKEFPGNTAGECSKVSVFSTGACDAFKEIKKYRDMNALYIMLSYPLLIRSIIVFYARYGIRNGKRAILIWIRLISIPTIIYPFWWSVFSER